MIDESLGETVTFDLSDPDDLELKMSKLSDQEMEQLLNQAYAVNNELTKELRRKDKESASESSSLDETSTTIYKHHD